MIELLGVGVPGNDGGWLLHRVCARLAAGSVTAVVSGRPRERHALLDVVTARRIPDEGRVWVRGTALMPDTARRIARQVREVDLGIPLEPERSALWNTLAARAPGLGRLRGFLRLPRPSHRQAALSALEAVGIAGRDLVGSLDAPDRALLPVARELVAEPHTLVLRDPDRRLEPAHLAGFIQRLKRLAFSRHLTVLVALDDHGAARSLADRAIGLADGLLIYDGPAAELPAPGHAFRPPALIRSSL